MELLSLRITSIQNETPDCRTYHFSLPGGEPFVYDAGQFLTFIIEHYGNEVRRSYSLCSTPGVDDDLFITIKRIQNGAVSRYLYNHLQVGNHLKALPPAGRFTLQHQAELYLFVAAGSGITPIFSLIKHLLFKQPESKVVLVYQNTSEQQSIFRNQLLALKNQFTATFQLVELFSQPLGSSNPQRLNNYLLERLVLEYVHTASVLYYTCGPQPFMLMTQFTLRLMGYRKEQIVKENFSIDPPPPAPFISDTSPHQVTINYNGATYRLKVAYPHNILEVALQNGISLPYSCRGGRCSTCLATCTKGTVKMSVNEVLTEKDVAKGLVLTCVGYPENDVELMIK